MLRLLCLLCLLGCHKVRYLSELKLVEMLVNFFKPIEIAVHRQWHC